MYSYKKYWERTLEVQFFKEIKRYKKLCNGRLKCDSKNPMTYSIWEKEVEQKLDKLDSEELNEFVRWIKLQIDENDSAEMFHGSFMFPLLAAVVAGSAVSMLTVSSTYIYMSVLSFIKNWICFTGLIISEQIIMKIFANRTRYKARFYKDIMEITQKHIEKVIA